uniref:GPN-loop GTPase n=1 Tax=Takifugu rubripes TaxID=31033 RepID=A0A674NMF7_TAKRU
QLLCPGDEEGTAFPRPLVPLLLPGIKPVCLIVLGMAGSGKTTFVQRLTAHLHSVKSPPYVINLDPAVHEVPFPANIDIRDTVNYKEVMKQYGLGPNGGIVTSLNLFATRFDQVMQFIEKKQQNHRYVLIDTPGQIEVFTWSASGTIITEMSLCCSLFVFSFRRRRSPAFVIYVMDTSRSVKPRHFMSNMLYACSILYKTKLPSSLTSSTKLFAVMEWMQEFEVFQDALNPGDLYVSNLTRSMSLVSCLQVVGVSAVTGSGLDKLFVQVEGRCPGEDYRPEYERLPLRTGAAGAAGATQEDLEPLTWRPQSLTGYGIAVIGGCQISDVFIGCVADFLSAEEADVAGPSDFIMTRGNRDDEEEAASDSDTDDDHKGSKERDAFGNFLTARKEAVQIRNRKCAPHDGC